VRCVAVFAALLLSACGVPSEPAKQAEDVASIAAEGAILAHDAAEGSTTSVFTRAHAEALQKKLRPLESKVATRELERLVAGVDAALGQLADDPGDRTSAARVERRLERAAKEAEELAG
jgi:hypothetical protein